MYNVVNKLSKINDSWQYYFWNLKSFQKAIRFDDEVKKNYFSDIWSYFDDTLPLLYDNEYTDDFRKSVFQSIGILQLIYAQQDLVDELLRVFRLPMSSLEDKQPNRKIRNELVGHPIRRKKEKGTPLVSSVFFRDLINGNLNYVIYSAENNFKGEIQDYKIDKIIEEHLIYLNKYFDLILDKIFKLLRELKKNLFEIISLHDREIEFPKIAELLDQRLETIFKDNYLFKKETLLECYVRKDEHPRYQWAVTYFTSSLKPVIFQRILGIDELLGVIKQNESKFEPINIVISPRHNYNSERELLTYEFSKLHEKHPVWGLDYFIRIFNKKDYLDKDVKESILIELNNMRVNIHSDLEFYSSYEYLRQIFIKQKLLQQ